MWKTATIAGDSFNRKMKAAMLTMTLQGILSTIRCGGTCRNVEAHNSNNGLLRKAANDRESNAIYRANKENRMKTAGVFLAIVGAVMLMASELGARAGFWPNLGAVLIGVLGGLLGVAGLVLVIRDKQAEATAKADAQAAAQAAAAAQKRQEIEERLKNNALSDPSAGSDRQGRIAGSMTSSPSGSYAGRDPDPRERTYTDGLSDAEISQAREQDMDLHGHIMG
jgi:hypothetical protein